MVGKHFVKDNNLEKYCPTGFIWETGESSDIHVSKQVIKVLPKLKELIIFLE